MPDDRSTLLDEFAVRRRLVDACKKAGSQRVWASEFGVSESYVSSVIGGYCSPGPKILMALGIREVVLYRDTKLKPPCEML